MKHLGFFQSKLDELANKNQHVVPTGFYSFTAWLYLFSLINFIYAADTIKEDESNDSVILHNDNFPNVAHSISVSEMTTTVKDLKDKGTTKEQSHSRSLEHHKEYRKNINLAKGILRKISKTAPNRFNYPPGGKLVATKDIFHGRYPSENQALFKKNQQIVAMLREVEDQVIKREKKILNDELSARAKSDPILLGIREEVAKVNKAYEKIGDYLFDIYRFTVHAAVAQEHKGGTCGNYAAIAIIESLHAGLDARMISLHDRKDPAQSHDFVVLGFKGGQLEDPLSWGDTAVIVDYWFSETKAISVADLKNDPDKYGIYFYQHWQWSEKKYSPTLPEELKGKYYSQYRQFRDYFEYCQKRLTEIISHTPELQLENTASLKL